MSYREDIRIRLIEVAKQGAKIPYKQLMDDFGLPRGGHPGAKNRVGDLVGNISNFEYENGRPLISSIVVRKANGYPGGGFFGLNGIPERLKRIEGEYKNPLSSDDKKFAAEEQKRVWDWWSRHNP
jgi:hypothetical protein